MAQTADVRCAAYLKVQIAKASPGAAMALLTPPDGVELTMLSCCTAPSAFQLDVELRGVPRELDATVALWRERGLRPEPIARPVPSG